MGTIEFVSTAQHSTAQPISALTIVASVLTALVIAGCNSGGGSNEPAPSNPDISSNGTSTNNPSTSTGNGSSNQSTTAPGTTNSTPSSKGIWSTRQYLSSLGTTGHNPQAVVDSAGNITAAWIECGAGSCKVRARQYNYNAGKWGEAIKIDNDSGADWSSNYVYRGSRSYMAISDNGTVVLAWGTAAGKVGASMINSASGAWEFIESPALDEACKTPRNAAVAIDPSGYAIITWAASRSNEYNVCSGVLDLNLRKWKNIQKLNSLAIKNASPSDSAVPTVVTSGAGQGYVAWATNQDVLVSRYDGNAWSPEKVVNSTGNVGGVVALMPYKGKVYAAWGGAGSTIRVNTFDPDSNKWGTEVYVSTPAYISDRSDHVALLIRNNTLNATWIHGAVPGNGFLARGYLATLQPDNSWKEVTGPSVYNFLMSFGLFDNGEKMVFSQPAGVLSTASLNASSQWTWTKMGDNAVTEDNAFSYASNGKAMAAIWLGRQELEGGVYINIYR